MKFLNVFKADLKRAFTSWYLWAAVFINIAAMALVICGYAYKEFARSELNNILSVIMLASDGSGMEFLTLNILPLLGFSMAMASDHEDKAIPFWSIRCGIERYIISKFLVASIAGFAVLFISCILFIIPFLPFLKMYDPNIGVSSYEFMLMIEDGASPVLAVLGYIFAVSMSGCFASAYAVCFSVFVPNKFAVLVSSLTIQMFIMLFIRGFDLSLNPYSPLYYINNLYGGATAYETIMYKIINYLIMGSILFIITLLVGRRKFRNG